MKGMVIQMAERRVPLRKCLGCGEMKEKRQLLRVVHSKTGETVVDITGKAAGRGAYVCGNIACFDAARKNRRFERAFSERIPDSVYESLRLRIAELEGAEQTAGK